MSAPTNRPTSDRVSSISAVAIALAGQIPALSAEPNRLTPEELAQGWLLLFDGESLFGWKAASEANWAVEGGVISVSEGDKGLLVTTGPVRQLRAEGRLPQRARAPIAACSCGPAPSRPT